jgi:DNA-binding response OmpR family regulator
LPVHILVVDDDPLTCELICEILLSAGMAADSVTDSAEAAGRLKREKYHAVFLDMRMPPPDGLELARQVRASSLNASAVIVMITGEEDRTVMRTRGALRSSRVSDLFDFLLDRKSVETGEGLR